MMTDTVFPVLVRRFVSGLVACLVLASVIHPVAAQAGAVILEDIEEVTARIQDDPDAPELYLLRGDLHRINGHWSDAIADFRKVQQLDPGNVEAELGMGRTYLDQGLYRLAIKQLSSALARQPDSVRGLVARAKAFRLLGEPLAAAEDYKRAIAVFQEPEKPIPEYYFERARAFEAAGLDYIGAALETLDAGISRLGDIRILEDYAVELERKRQHYDAALLRLARIIDRSERKEALLVTRGEILLEAGRTVEAEADFDAALAAIDALPPLRRHTPAMQQLRTDIASRIESPKPRGGR